MKIEPKMFEKVKDEALLETMFKSAIHEANSLIEIRLLEAAYHSARERIRAERERKQGGRK